MRYDVTQDGHLKDIGGKRRRVGDVITLNAREAQFEVSRGTVTEHKTEKAQEPKAKGK